MICSSLRFKISIDNYLNTTACILIVFLKRLQSTCVRARKVSSSFTVRRYDYKLVDSEAVYRETEYKAKCSYRHIGLPPDR